MPAEMDRLKPALDAAIPLLREIERGFGRKPTASAAKAAMLRELSCSRKDDAPAGTLRQEREVVSGGASHGQTQIDATSPRIIPSREWTLETLREAALRCTECPHLVRTRTQVVFGVGNPNADLMFVGEAPGADEDIQGEPFVGRAGQLLTKIIQTMGFSRDAVYIGNVLKCRPDMPPGSTGNRKPRPEEMRTCLPWLEKQIELIQPKVLVALGATAVEGLLGDTRPMRELRGRWLDYRGIPVMATYHPAYLLRNQSISEKRKVWEDMLLVLEKLGAPISEKQRGYFMK
jgi:uracil-DNA glycosylase, family 4